jgi:hypothetical protein
MKYYYQNFRKFKESKKKFSPPLKKELNQTGCLEFHGQTMLFNRLKRIAIVGQVT